ncbi:hypothetical protein [Dyadobacter sp. CY323]|uniref:chryseobasin-related MNIO class RiPP peptide n=1 Tax=Dyadobacter sp. CY323 TaxID=2907302 RepID=UPI001F1BBF26|nr:hypothetical protein [Dyadobacter sp. CY323]MCE6992293.1 hypothetical protein [Dyadobacter sp. CY323]
MKISKTILQAVAVSVAIATITSTVACTDYIIKPGEKKENKKKSDPCPACGMG